MLIGADDGRVGAEHHGRRRLQDGPSYPVQRPPATPPGHRLVIVRGRPRRCPISTTPPAPRQPQMIACGARDAPEARTKSDAMHIIDALTECALRHGRRLTHPGRRSSVVDHGLQELKSGGEVISDQGLQPARIAILESGDHLQVLAVRARAPLRRLSEHMHVEARTVP